MPLGIKSNNNMSADWVDVTITAGQSLSTEADCGGMRVIGLKTDAALVGTALTFQGAMQTGAEANVYDDTGTEFSVTASTNRAISWPTKFAILFPYQYIKVRGGSSGSPTVQTTAAGTTTVRLYLAQM